MYAREYAKLKGYPYPLILQFCREGKIPSLKRQKYVIDPEEADAAIAALKIAPEHTERQSEVTERKQDRKKETEQLVAARKTFNYLDELKKLARAK